MTKIQILTPDPADPDFADLWREQADDLAAALALAGLETRFAPWPAEPEPAALTLPLLAWGYHRDIARWLAALDAWTHAGVRLANPPDVLRWNADKRYLLDLAARGVPVVPTRAVDTLTDAALAEARAAFRVETLIAKPPVSAGAHGTFRLAPGDPLPDWDGAMLLQPLLPAVATEGEWSLFRFAGRYSHAVLKRPANGDFRVQWQHGGEAAAADPPRQARAAADRLLAAVEPLTYARIDLIAGEDGRYLLMELEAIEPDLFLEHAPDSGRLFAEAVAAHLAPTLSL